ncbi:MULTISPECIES: ABC transporter substrate-binding protein [Burkholderia]|uniref:ABC transporter substrate-binding protein n=1 Tax=Burkholderia TaxID=32008 RepID=UPI000668A6F8|nr:MULTISPECIES: ABC transporter substrate-binding protein [Burkholderia]AQQ43397.1 branched-chain amino acid ABC transporter substrate-binding protein [Burkholderia cenocepacia]KWF29043.1 branched-chain amino acid ABC transporter substrate-binding protein [Burkholderia cenocepacia]MBG0870881.1 ABC transporter substrate-binding protein [Burkholderia sp. 9777_1386]MBG0877319.1 ABC transporter substrate-binding protein [Burkholderia sp. 9775_39]MBG0883654.1 ABC transporter substrate-binding prot
MTLPALLRRTRQAAGAALVLACAAAHADLKVGVDLSSTGPAAAIGITSKNAILMWPKTIAGQPVQVTVLDDASDPGAAVRNIRKLVDEDHVDVVVGPNITPAALAALDAVAAAQTPMITLVGSGSIVEPQEGARTWAFKMAQSDRAMADVMTRYMANHGVKTVGFIGFADSYGDSWLNEFTRFADLRKIRVIATERFNRTDASVTGQALKLIAAKPDAILIAGAGTPTVLPQRTLIERGYKGPIYQTHGIATPEFIKLGGKDVDGTLFPTQPVVVARTLPADHPARQAALAFVDAYEAKYGAGTVTQFAGDAAGVYPRLADAVGRALKAAQPGTPAFRAALRRELERAHELVVPNGVVNTSDKDHVGLDQRASVMGIVKQGRFVYLSQ